MTPEEWQLIPFGDCVDAFIDFRGRTPKKVGMEWGGHIPALSANNVEMGRINPAKDTKYGSEALYKRWMTSGDADKGDVVFTMEAPLGNVAQVPDDRKYILSQRVVLIKAKKRLMSPDFLSHAMAGYAFQRQLRARATGTTARGIQRARLVKIPILVPPVPEQRKIAAILSSVDNAIEKTQAVIDQVQLVKRGLMEELLTRGLPGRHTLFKQTEIGEIPGDWDKAPLKTRVKLQPGFAFKSAEFSTSGDRLLRGSNVGVGQLAWEEDKTKYFPGKRRAEFSDYVLREGDVIVAMDRPFISDGFKTARVTADDLPALLLQRVGRFRDYRELTPDYLWHLLQSRYVKEHLQVQQKGTDLPHISKSEIESSICPFPPVDEQERIAACLDTLDRYVTQSEREQDQAGRLKTGLMDVLLSGDLRVSPNSEAA